MSPAANLLDMSAAGGRSPARFPASEFVEGAAATLLDLPLGVVMFGGGLIAPESVVVVVVPALTFTVVAGVVFP